MRKLSAVVLSMALVFNSMSMVSAGTEQDANDAYETSTQVENPWAELLGSGEDGTIENVTEENEQVLDNPWEDLFEDETTTEEPTTEEPTTEEPTTEEPTTEETTAEVVTNPVEFAITKQPQDVMATVGTSYTMSVTATGNGLTYQWQMSSDNGVTWNDSTVNGCKTNTIRFTVSDAYHGRKYRCVVKDANNNTIESDAGTVMIEALMNQLVITKQPKSVVTSVGSKNIISVGAAGTGLTYQWQMSSDGGVTWADSSIDGNKTSNIIVRPTELYHGRQYRCVVSDQNGNSVESEGATILIDTLKDELMIIKQPKNVISAVNAKNIISIGATGNGLSYQWQMSSDGGVTWKDSSIDGCKTSNIIVRPTEAYHGRTYRCVVTDENGDSVASEGSTILIDTLKDQLMVIAQPQNKIVTVGQKEVISVGATGNGLSYQWQMSTDGGATWTDSSVDGNKTSNISFRPTEAYHGRQYRCVITDQNGDTVESNGGTILIDTLADRLMIVTQPKAATTTSLNTKTVISVGATGNGLKYQWQMSSDGGITWKDSSVDGCKTTAISFKPTTAYHGRQYRCVVTDNAGNSVASNGGAIIIDSMANQLAIIAQPLDVTVASGVKVRVPIIAVGEGLTYQWQLSKDGGKTWADSTVDGFKSNTITFTSASTYNGRQYRCVIKDKNGNTVTTRGAVINVQ